MKFPMRLLLTALLSVSLLAAAPAADRASNSPAPATYVLTNDDGTVHSYVSFYTPGSSQGAPTLSFVTNVITQGLGIGGGYFGLPRLSVLTSGSTSCLFASNAATGDISGLNIQTKQVMGTFLGSDTDEGDTSGIGVVANTNYLYAAYTTSNTIGTFSVLPGCQLSFLGDTPAAGLNGGSVSGMALHGGMLVVAYADGSIESFDVGNGIPVSNGDAQNSTAFNSNHISFPDGVDISSDGHFAIFGDSSVNTLVEVSDISSGKLAATVPYTLGGGGNAVGPSVRAPLTGVNSAAVRLSPDESMVFISNNENGTVSAGFFNRQTGKVTSGCSSQPLAGFFHPWAFTGSLATRDNTGSGGVLYVAEHGGSESSIGVLTIVSNGSLCSLMESTASEVGDSFSDGLLSIATYPPRSF